MWGEHRIDERYPHQCWTTRGKVRPKDCEAAGIAEHFARFPFQQGDRWGFETAEELRAFRVEFTRFMMEDPR